MGGELLGDLMKRIEKKKGESSATLCIYIIVGQKGGTFKLFVSSSFIFHPNQ